MTYNVFGGTLNLTLSILVTVTLSYTVSVSICLESSSCQLALVRVRHRTDWRTREIYKMAIVNFQPKKTVQIQNSLCQLDISSTTRENVCNRE